MITIKNCKQYLSQNYFTNIQFTHQKEDNLYFTAYDTEEEQNAQLEFELEEGTLYINVKYESDEDWLILERLSLEDWRLSQ
ncbi:hypothetical protein [Metabacillus arenae]|uniref:Uncharacterized protein n=1 Tax=Metabacillus arenae TaxID=2771434 RepID=A0A926N9E7_9BACI|nr:hypothetical protein [Metabacillus arenae]MBD1379169.1 hypothetical protein [Metabacillus arenae]